MFIKTTKKALHKSRVVLNKNTMTMNLIHHDDTFFSVFNTMVKPITSIYRNISGKLEWLLQQSIYIPAIETTQHYLKCCSTFFSCKTEVVKYQSQFSIITRSHSMAAPAPVKLTHQSSDLKTEFI